MTMKNRKGMFLHSSIMARLTGTPLRKDGDSHDDGIDVGAGFGDAAARMGGDDNRPNSAEKGDDQDEGNQSDDGGNAGETGDDQGDGDADGDGDGDADEGGAAKPEKGTAKYIRELKRELREEKRRNSTFEQRLSQIERGGLPIAIPADKSEPTRAAPDPSDAEKYPLGVLDDRYIEEKIEWAAEQKVTKVLDGERQSERARAEQASAEAHMATLREKVDTLAETGADLFDDYEEKVLEAGLRGEWLLSETTFTAASEADHGAEILYSLANDKAEAKRVAELSPLQQVKYIAKKDAEIAAAKPQARHRPKAGDPPSNLPRGRNSSSPIRADTDNLDDFRKLYYAKK